MESPWHFPDFLRVIFSDAGPTVRDHALRNDDTTSCCLKGQQPCHDALKAQRRLIGAAIDAI
jgi:hypothetical protein